MRQLMKQICSMVWIPLIILLAAVSCGGGSDGGESPGVASDIDITFQSAVQTGGVSGTTDSTGLTLSFSDDPMTLTAENITISGATKGALSGTGTTRHLEITDITVANGETVSVTVASPAGYAINGSLRTAVVYKETAGFKETCVADGVSFVMVYVPGGMTCPVGMDDTGPASVDDAYWIGETEVTYELWSKVYSWATTGSGAAGAGQYSFENVGRQGGDTGAGPVGTVQHPVTTINWRDSIVWCNALTEWYNAEKGLSYECVYKHSGVIIRDSSVNNRDACDNVVPNSTAKGFRLPSNKEWQLAARYRNGTLWTYGDHVSGDETGACYDDGSILGGLEESTVFGDYAVYAGNSGSTTAMVKSKINGNNALGLYDMSGNVWEWCFDLSGDTLRVWRGGGWDSPASRLMIGFMFDEYPYQEYSYIGFRIARTQ